MYFILKLIILLEIFSITNQCKAYVLQTTEHSDNNNNLSELDVMSTSQQQQQQQQSSFYIDNIIKPNEIREPKTLQEIVNYIGADKLSNTAVMPEVEEQQQHTLTYTELTKLLAFWQWAKEQNFYEMQTERMSNTNDNYVTLD